VSGGFVATLPGVLALAYDNTEGEADLVYADGALEDESDGDLEVAVLMSLHCDAPALDTDAIPEGASPGGWVGDDFDDDAAGPIGSRLWLLEACVVNEANAARAREYTREALKWMVDDGLVKSVDAETQIGGEAIELVPVVTKKNGDPIRFSPLQVGG
jgi:phage gp46-like protein